MKLRIKCTSITFGINAPVLTPVHSEFITFYTPVSDKFCMEIPSMEILSMGYLAWEYLAWECLAWECLAWVYLAWE